MRQTWQRWLALSACGALVSCATTGDPVSTGRGGHATPSRGSVVTGAELMRERSDETLLDALRHFRPFFLKTRGSTPLVMIDGATPQALGMLETVHTSAVSDVTLIRPPSLFDCCRHVLFVRLRHPQ